MSSSGSEDGDESYNSDVESCDLYGNGDHDSDSEEEEEEDSESDSEEEDSLEQKSSLEQIGTRKRKATELFIAGAVGEEEERQCRKSINLFDSRLIEKDGGDTSVSMADADGMRLLLQELANIESDKEFEVSLPHKLSHTWRRLYGDILDSIERQLGNESQHERAVENWRTICKYSYISSANYGDGFIPSVEHVPHCQAQCALCDTTKDETRILHISHLKSQCIGINCAQLAIHAIEFFKTLGRFVAQFRVCACASNHLKLTQMVSLLNMAISKVSVAHAGKTGFVLKDATK